MTDLEKAKHLLELLSTNNYNIEGINDAFKLTQSYSWLFMLVKQMEEAKDKTEKEGK